MSKMAPFTALFLCLPLLIAISGCARRSVSFPTPPSPDVFTSKDYIVYQMKSGDTSQSLAGLFLGDSGKDWMIEDANAQQAFYPGNYIVIPRTIRNRGGITSSGVQTIPILCYHRFGGSCESPLCVPEKIFEKQMAFLKDNGYRVISVDDLIGFLEYRLPVPRKAVMITVDDGYRSFYDVAYPVLKHYGFPATLFIYTDFVGVSSKALTWRQLREMKADGITIGSHTIAHSDLTKQNESESDETYANRLYKEIVSSKKIIDQKLNQDTLIFAYPFGRANSMAMTMVRQAGYRLAVTVNRGGNPFFSNPFLIKRDQILSRDMKTFKSRLQTFHPLTLR